MSRAHLEKFSTPNRRLMGAGPSNIYPEVSEALTRPEMGHLDPLFVKMMDEVKSMLRYVFQTKNEFAIAVSAPGSAGMEACFVNLVEPGDKVVVCVNGLFGGRMVENVERIGGTAVVIQDEWGTPVSVKKLEVALKENPDTKIVAFVHAETSTGVRSDAETIARIAKEHNCLVIADTVTSLAGIPVMTDEWGLDAVYSGSQKCLSSVAGLSPLTFSDKAIEKITNRSDKIQSWFLDQTLVLDYWSGEGKRSYHHTAPINSVYALHESLRQVCNEGLENSWQKHLDAHIRLKKGLEELNFNFVVEEEYRLPQMNSIYVPDNIDELAVRMELLNDFNLEIGAGLGKLSGKIWRIGLMGYNARNDSVDYCLNTLKKVLNK